MVTTLVSTTEDFTTTGILTQQKSYFVFWFCSLIFCLTLSKCQSELTSEVTWFSSIFNLKLFTLVRVNSTAEISTGIHWRTRLFPDLSPLSALLLENILHPFNYPLWTDVTTSTAQALPHNPILLGTAVAEHAGRKYIQFWRAEASKLQQSQSSRGKEVLKRPKTKQVRVIIKDVLWKTPLKANWGVWSFCGWSKAHNAIFPGNQGCL